MKKNLKGEEVLNLIDEVTNKPNRNEFNEVILDGLLNSNVTEEELLGDVLSNSEKLKLREKEDKVKSYYEKEDKVRENLKAYGDDIF